MYPSLNNPVFRIRDRRNQPMVPKELTGKGVAWDRGQTRIVGSGRTFDEAKDSAAAAGQSAVLMARVSEHHRGRFGRPLLSIVAVFISQMS
jgi:hypothetical protein